MAVTEPCRFLPMVFLGQRKMPAFVNSLFYYIPFAVLSALVLPDILTSTGNQTSAIAGAVAAVFVSLFLSSPMYSMIAAIAASYAVLTFIG